LFASPLDPFIQQLRHPLAVFRICRHFVDGQSPDVILFRFRGGSWFCFTRSGRSLIASSPSFTIKSTNVILSRVEILTLQRSRVFFSETTTSPAINRGASGLNDLSSADFSSPPAQIAIELLRFSRVRQLFLTAFPDLRCPPDVVVNIDPIEMDLVRRWRQERCPGNTVFSPSFLQKLPHLVFPSGRISSRSFADLFGGGGGISITQIYLATFVRQTRSAVMRAGLAVAHTSL